MAAFSPVDSLSDASDAPTLTLGPRSPKSHETPKGRGTNSVKSPKEKQETEPKRKAKAKAKTSKAGKRTVPKSKSKPASKAKSKSSKASKAKAKAKSKKTKRELEDVEEEEDFEQDTAAEVECVWHQVAGARSYAGWKLTPMITVAPVSKNHCLLPCSSDIGCFFSFPSGQMQRGSVSRALP